MLKSLRKSTKVVVWTMVVAFGLWGAFSVGVQFQDDGRFAGEVFDKKITIQEFDRFYRGSRLFSFGSTPIQDPDVLRHVAWQNLIYAHAAEGLDIQVSDDEVRQELQRILAAQGLGAPTPEVYQGWLRRVARMGPHEFESQLREMIRIQKLTNNVSKLPLEQPSEEEVRKFFMLDQKHLTADTALFSTRERAEEAVKAMAAGRSWEDALAQTALSTEHFNDTSLAELSRRFRLLPQQVEDLFELAPGNISSPLPVEGGWAVFRVLEKNENTGAELTEEQKQKYTELAEQWKKRERMVLWHLGLMKEANFKDYLAERAAGEK